MIVLLVIEDSRIFHPLIFEFKLIYATLKNKSKNLIEKSFQSTTINELLSCIHPIHSGTNLSKFELKLRLNSDDPYILLLPVLTFSSKKNKLGVTLPPLPVWSGEFIIKGLFISPPLSDNGVDIRNFCLDLSSSESIYSRIGFARSGSRPPLYDMDNEPARWTKNLHFLPLLKLLLSF